MESINLKDGTSIEVTIKNASLNDIEALVFLNQKWQKSSLAGNIKDGYVGAAFSRETFENLISKNQITVAENSDKIIGYYLLNNFSKDGIIGKHQDIVDELKLIGKIDKETKVCVGAQAVVDNDFMGSGIRQLMLKKLVSNMKNNYEFLFATIAKDNPRAFKAHTRDGWFVVDENEELYYVFYKV